MDYRLSWRKREVYFFLGDQQWDDAKPPNRQSRRLTGVECIDISLLQTKGSKRPLRDEESLGTSEGTYSARGEKGQLNFFTPFIK